MQIRINRIGNYTGETAKSLRVCKIVLDEQSSFESLELVGDHKPR